MCMFSGTELIDNFSLFILWFYLVENLLKPVRRVGLSQTKGLRNSPDSHEPLKKSE